MDIVIRRAEPGDFEAVCGHLADASALRDGQYVDAHAMARMRPKPGVV
jgi:hypothetical protein